MSVEFVKYDSGLAADVVNEIWDRGVREAMLFGVTRLTDVWRYVEMHGNDRHAYIAVNDEKPVAVFGAYPVNDTTLRTWFVATNDFSSSFVGITRKLKSLMETEAPKDGFHTIETLSACIHPKAEKWFKTLGLLPEPNYANENGIRQFIKEV